MTRLTLDISMSLDGFVAGPKQTLEQPLGEGGERLHEWVFGLRSWRERHGLSGGETNVDADIVHESLDTTGAIVMGRRMFSGGAGRGKRTRTRTAGGGTSRRSACLCSCSPATPARRRSSREERPSPS
jgi:dihydrofolate reductase